jgi:ribosomal protein L40E
MSVVGVIIVVSRKEKLMKTICVFCFAVYEAETTSCYPCKEYKGIMPLNKETLEYLGEDLEDWQDYLG